MLIFSFFVFLVLLTMGGISLDLMRQETERTQIQTTLDSAVLAAAGAPGSYDEEQIGEIVEDFFVKSGKEDYLEPFQEGDIVARVNARVVNARAKTTLNTYIMKLMGVNTMDAKGAAGASVRTPKLEIVLALDVSGSMNGSKIANLKTAAKNFVSTVLASSDPGTTVISIVPYSWGATPSNGMFEALNVNVTHDNSTCIAFQEEDFQTAAIRTDTPYAQRIYTSRFGNSFDDFSTNSWRTCYTEDYMRILPFSIDEDALHTKIDALEADGNTSSHMGMKWAAGLIDPAFDDVITTLQQERTYVQEDGTTASVIEIDPSLENLPADYGDMDTRKIIVLMGDGQNTSTYQFGDPNGLLDRNTAETHASSDYRGPNSYLHKIMEEDEEFDYAFDLYDPSREWHEDWVEQYCYLDWLECVYNAEVVETHYVYRPSNNRYYPVDGSESLSGSEFNDLLDDLLDDLPDGIEDPATGLMVDPHVQYSWEEAWGRMTPYFVYSLTGNTAPYYNFINNRVYGSEKDVRMSNICGATKSHGVIVYSIGFEVGNGSNAENQLQACASEPSKYYRASGLEIVDVFGSIAENVQSLRLTQ